MKLQWRGLLSILSRRTPVGERVAATLQILNGKTAGTKHPLIHPVTRIGRHPECEIQIDISAASRIHAHVDREGDNYFIVDGNPADDKESRNGTFVNGKKTEKNERVRLKDNDRVKVCDLLFVFRAEKPAEEDHDGSQVLSTWQTSSVDHFKVKPEAKLRAILEISQ